MRSVRVVQNQKTVPGAGPPRGAVPRAAERPWVQRHGACRAAGEGSEAKHPDCKPLFTTEQSGNFATTRAQIRDHFPSNKTITL